MANEAVWRSGSLAVGVLAGVMLARGAALLSARPPDRPPVDVHAEYVKFASGRDSITAYLAYPESAEPAAAVLVIHEIFGMSDFVRGVTQTLAQKGFVALAPDLLSRWFGGGRMWKTSPSRCLRKYILVLRNLISVPHFLPGFIRLQ